MAIRQVTRAGVGLVVGIIIIALLVFGGLWLVNQRGEQARREEAINIADEQLRADSDQDIAIDTNTDTAPAEESQPQETTPTTQPSNTAAAPEATTATELPQTGPGVGPFVMVGILAFAVGSFIHSRKLVA